MMEPAQELLKKKVRSVKKVLEGTVSLPGKYSKLMEEAMLEYKEEQLTLVKTEV